MEYNTELVKQVREQLNISQSELARRLGVKHNTVWRWEHKKAEPLLENYIKLINLLKNDK